MGTFDFDLFPQPISSLQNHPVETTDRLHPRKPVLRIRNFHFTVLSIHCFIPGYTAVFRQMHSSMHEVNQDEKIRFQEGIQTALYVLYVLNIPLGECIVQRDSVREYVIYQVKPLKAGTLTTAEQKIVRRFVMDARSYSSLTFGADIECLLQNRRTGKWVSASSVTAENKSIGYDNAIAVKGNKVSHPILELRPNPAMEGRQLHQHLHILYRKLQEWLKKNDLRVDTTGFGRFHVGGHLHVGNHPLTFKHVRNLDIFLALPFALIESGNPLERRRRFGRLGSARPNSFSGFEYRSLGSWVERIPELLPMLEWFCFLNEHAGIFPTLEFSEAMLHGYYQHSIENLKGAFDRIEDICQNVLPSEDFNRYASPFFHLVLNETSML